MNLMTLDEINKHLEEVKYNTINLSELGQAKVDFHPADSDDESDFSIIYENQKYTLDHHAERQFLQMMNIPYGFYKRLPAEMRKEIYSHCAKEEDIKKKPISLKERDQQIFAMLKESYGILNTELIDEIKKMKVWDKFDLFQAYISDHKFDFRAMIVGKNIENINEVIKNASVGEMYPGVHIQNGETGRAFKIMPVIFRLRCTNGLITPWRTMSDGFRIPTFREYSKITEKMPELVLRSLLYATENEKRFRQLMNTKVDNPSGLLTRFSEEYQIPNNIRQEALKQLNYSGEQEMNGTAFSIVNAITASARQEEDPDKRIKMEQIAWKVAERRFIN